MTTTLGLFEGFGIELEYMLVDADTLKVAPIADKVLEAAAGEVVNDYDNGPIAWSNELAAHVIELKTNGPVARISDEVVQAFCDDLWRIDDIAAEFGARLLPTAMHPTMQPVETVLWPHEGNEIYSTYDRVFGCTGHGWGNLQSCHLNLPFCGDEQFGALHAAIRPLLSLLPALAASSPVIEGRITGKMDSRLSVYAENQRRIPSIIGRIIPEPAWTEEDYETQILIPMWQAIAPLDPQGELQHEWLNSRGAIARFERNAIEIRLLDVQETPAADLSIARLVSAAAHALTQERFVPMNELKALPTEMLREMLDRGIVDADEAIVDDEKLLRALGCSDLRLTAGEVWTSLFETLLMDELAPRSKLRSAMVTILGQGPLSRRILAALGRNPTRQRIHDTYLRIADGLASGDLFRP